MPILYEAIPFIEPIGKPLTKKELQVVEAPRWRVVQEYGVNAIYMTPDQLVAKVRDAFVQAAKEKGCTVEWFRVIDMWAEWKVFWTEYHAVVEAVIAGSPITEAVIIAIIGLITAIVYLVMIYLIATRIIEPLFAPPKEGLPTIVWVALGIGGAILIGGIGYYLITRPKT
jgi:hypothetical protein